MLFTSPTFLFGFLPIVLLLYYLLPNKSKNTLLLLVSLIFYAWGELQYVWVLVASIFSNYIFGRFIDKNRSHYYWLFIGVAFNLGLLFYFKYYGFISNKPDSIHLPLGISFFTFQAISYLVDVKRKKAKVQLNFINLGLYISLFPQLIAGPIVRYNTIAKQIKERVHNTPLFTAGVERFCYGLAKKVLIANALGAVADPIFALDNSQLSFSLSWLAIVCFSLQIYFDFSAYSDMAIGLGRMFGFQLQENFNYPYIATSIQDFWRRWHISLSTWFKDYLYIPLGGNQKGTMRTYFNLLLVFILCGFWHGASWNFLIWGLLHGAFLIIERLGLAKILQKLPRFFSRIYTLLVLMVTWVFFKIENLSDAVLFLKKMFYINHESINLYSYHYFMSNYSIIALVAAFILATPIAKKYVTYYPDQFFKGTLIAVNIRATFIITLFFLSLIIISAATYNPFIYFRF
jgi:alginate O-acetyltransferase complex protein AlgI